VALRRWNQRNAEGSLNVAARLPMAEEDIRKNMMTMILTKKRRTTITISLLPGTRNMKKTTTKMMTTIMMKMKTTTIMSNLIPGMRTKKMKTMAAGVALITTTIMIAVIHSQGVRARVSSVTAADNMKTGAKIAVRAVAVPIRVLIREDVPQATAGVLPVWTANR